MSSLSVARISTVTGKQPLFDNSGSYYFYDGTPDGPPLPEYQPYRGFTRNYADIYISGIEVTGEIYEDGTPLSNFNGPMDGSLMVLWLILRSGTNANLGNWTQIGAADYNELMEHNARGGGARHPLNNLIPNLGGWTKFCQTPNSSGIRVVGYYRIATRREARSTVRWRIQTAPSGQSVISQVCCFMIRPQWFREPIAPVVATRSLPITRSYSVPGVRTPITPDVDASESGYSGGNLIMTVNAIGGSYDTVNGNLPITPARVGSEGYGGFIFGPYNPPYQMYYSFLTTFGMPDNRLIADSEVATQKPGAYDIGYAGITAAFPSPPNVQIPLATQPLNSIKTSFESGTLNDTFTVSGAGVPKVVP